MRPFKRLMDIWSDLWDPVNTPTKGRRLVTVLGLITLILMQRWPEYMVLVLLVLAIVFAVAKLCSKLMDLAYMRKYVQPSRNRKVPKRITKVAEKHFK